MSEVASEPSTQRSSDASGRERHRDTGGEPARSAQPRRYRPPVSRLWWLPRRSYVLFVLRELSSVFVAWFVVYLLLLVDAVHGGSDSYQAVPRWAGNPWVVVLNIVALAFVVLHAVTLVQPGPAGARDPAAGAAAAVADGRGRRTSRRGRWPPPSVAWIVLRGL